MNIDVGATHDGTIMSRPSGSEKATALGRHFGEVTRRHEGHLARAARCHAGALRGVRVRFSCPYLAGEVELTDCRFTRESKFPAASWYTVAK